MTITFISNYINHHQLPFSDACYKLLGCDYQFIQTQVMEEERIAMGWSTKGVAMPYVHCLYEETEYCERLIMESDILLVGWNDREDLIGKRLEAGKLTIRVSERLYREGQWKAVSPRGLVQKYKDHTRYRKEPVCLLCAGAYVASDFKLVHAYPQKMFRWGYFPQTRVYSPEEWDNLKPEQEKIQIIWAGRFIPLKHPEYMIQLADALSKKGYSFHIHMAGSGVLEEELRTQIADQKLEQFFTFYGFCTPERVRELMEKSHIHIFTSNQLEGWGAVVNEAMNSGCAEVCNVQVGAAPYLIEHRKNGLLYNKSYEEMEAAVCYLLQNPDERRQMGRAAYETILHSWNAEHAAGEFVRFAGELMQGRIEPAVEGPLSIAPVLSPRCRKNYW